MSAAVAEWTRTVGDGRGVSVEVVGTNLAWGFDIFPSLKKIGGLVAGTKHKISSSNNSNLGLNDPLSINFSPDGNESPVIST